MQASCVPKPVAVPPATGRTLLGQQEGAARGSPLVLLAWWSAARSDIELSCAEASGGGSEQQVAAKGSNQDWHTLAEKVFEQDDRPIILYDGVCNLCNGGVNFMLDWDSPNEERGRFRFAALQSNVGRALLQRSGRRPDDCNSIILALKDGNTYAKGEAVLRIGQVTLRISEEENIF